MTIESCYDSTIWEIYGSVAASLYQRDARRINRHLRELAREIILTPPLPHVVWLMKAFRRGMQMMKIEFVGHPLNLGIIGLLVATCVLPVGRPASIAVVTAEMPAAQQPHSIGFHVLLCIAVVFAGCKLIMVMLVAPPLGCFMGSASIFFTPAAVAGLTYLRSGICSPALAGGRSAETN